MVTHMKMIQSLVTASAFAALGGLALQSASFAQSAAGLATSITSQSITASGVAGTFENSAATSADGFFASGLSAGDSGATATFCLDTTATASEPVGGSPDVGCFAGNNNATVDGALPGGEVIVLPTTPAALAASASGPGLPLQGIPSGGSVVILFDSIFGN
jgi:hypothetical protein